MNDNRTLLNDKKDIIERQTDILNNPLGYCLRFDLQCLKIL